MGLDSLGDVGVAGILVVLILREVFGYMSKMQAQEAEVAVAEDPASDAHARIEDAVAALASTSAQMATILCRTDGSGAPMVYTPSSLTAAIEGLSRNADRLSEKVERINA